MTDYGSAAGMAHALAQGFSGFAGGIKEREEAQRLKEDRDLQLQEFQQNQQLRGRQMSNEELRAQQLELDLNDTKNKLAQQDTYRAFDAYSADGNPRHLNRVIQENPTLRELFADTASVDRVDPANDIELIKQAGLTADIFTNPETAQAANKRILKVTRTDGAKQLIDMMQLYAGTGYTKYLSDEDLKRRLTEAQIGRYEQLSAGGDGGGGTEGSDTAMVRNARAVAEARERIRAGEGTLEDEEIVRFGTQQIAGTTPGKMEYADQSTQSLINSFGDEDTFFSTDFSNPTNFRKAYPYISKIEAAEDIKWTAEEKKQLGNIRSLIAMGDPAEGLTEADTGLIDSTFNNVKKYIFEEVDDGVKAASAYAAFRNTARHALYGSALTQGEIDSFNEAFGTLGQKLGPVLQQFKTSLVQVKAQLGSIASMNNPYVAKVRLGIDQENIDDIINSIDQRVEYLNSKLAIAPERKQELDAIFKPGSK